ncbi:MAG TPA: nuclear transport factor 2 family protein [Paracoccaceae bacterium]|nr:nuclear transport factor 2 family protein [Paracoccaceae bacterium]
MATMTDQKTAEAEIGALLEGWLEAYRAKNAEGVLAHQTGDFVQFSLAPPLISRDADAAGLNRWFATWKGSLGFEIRDLDLTVGGDVAFGHCLTRLSGTTAEGEEASLWFRQTLGFRRLGGAWRIAHQHESVPFYMDGSFKASIDLAP